MCAVKNLWAKTGSISMPGGNQTGIWGYAESQVDTPILSGPVIEGKVNELMQINLNNMLTEPTSLIFPGQNMTPTPLKDMDGRFISYNTQVESGQMGTYSFTAARPGIFRYESGTASYKQVQMGLYGIMIIRPEDYDANNPALRTAYGAGNGSEFDVEGILVLGEIDSDIHNRIINSLPYNFIDYNPDYFIINGRAYPDTVNPSDSSSQPYTSKITASQGQRILIRCINLGYQNYNIRFDSMAPRIIAVDSYPLNEPPIDKSFMKNTITISSGESYDLILVAPSTGKYIIYDRSYNHTVNQGAYPGGIMTLLEVL